jgi:hypothetical protein
MLKNSVNRLIQSQLKFTLRYASSSGSTAAAAASIVKNDKYQELNKLEKRPLYLDAQATLPIDPRVLDSMLPYMWVFFF